MLYDYSYDNYLEWPCITCKWLSTEEEHSSYLKEEVVFGCRTDHCDKLPSLLVIASVKVPKPGYTFD